MFITSWNMQGAQGFADPAPGTRKRKQLSGSNIGDAIGLLTRGTVQVVALQEAGTPPGNWNLVRYRINGYTIQVGTIGLGTASRGRQAMVAWFDSAENSLASHARCSLAIISTSYASQPRARNVGLMAAPSASLRPLLGLRTASGLWVYSIHAPSGNHVAAAGVARSQLQHLPPGRRWVCVGDYNCTPPLMAAQGFTPIASTHATQQQGNILDFAVASPGVSCVLDNSRGLLISDHYSQTFNVI